MKTMYLARREQHDDIYPIGIYDTLEEAAFEAEVDRDHLTPAERATAYHDVHQVDVPDAVNTIDDYIDACENDPSITDAIATWTISTKQELRDLARELGWDPTNEAETMDCIKTNWENVFTDGEIRTLYEYLVDEHKRNNE